MKVILFLFFVVCTQGLYAQLQVKETATKTTIGAIKRSNNLIAELSYVVKNPGDTTYTFTYNNYEHKIKTDFKSVTFKGTTGTIDSLYKLVTAVFKPGNKKNKEYSVSLKLGEDSAWIGLTRIFGVTRLVIRSGGGYVYLTENEVDKLFGKKD